ncbi:MAG TPA: CU044_2847 family protein [Streptosporangiaceae bacterium]
MVEVSLPNGTVALVQAADVDGGAQAAEKVAWTDAFDFAHVSATLDGVAQAIRSGLQKAAPTKTTVELGIDLAVKNGQLTGLLVNGQAHTSLKVTLEWTRTPPPGAPGDD